MTIFISRGHNSHCDKMQQISKKKEKRQQIRMAQAATAAADLTSHIESEAAKMSLGKSGNSPQPKKKEEEEEKSVSSEGSTVPDPEHSVSTKEEGEESASDSSIIYNEESDTDDEFKQPPRKKGTAEQVGINERLLQALEKKGGAQTLVGDAPILNSFMWKDVDRVQKAYHSRRLQGATSTVEQLIDSSLHEVLSMQLELKGKRAGTDISDTWWFTWEPDDLFEELKSWDTKSGGEGVDQIRSVGQELAGMTCTMRVLSETDNLVFLSSIVKVVREKVPANLVQDKSKEAMLPIREGIYKLLQKSAYGKQLVIDMKSVSSKDRDWSWTPWLKTLMQFHHDAVVGVNKWKRYILEEHKEMVLLEARARGQLGTGGHGGGSGNGKKSTKGRDSDNGGGGPGGGGHKRKRDQGDKSSDPSASTNASSSSTATGDVPCGGCGRIGHTKDGCLWKDHPDWNSTNTTWDESKPGKAWKIQTFPSNVLPVKFTLDKNVKETWLKICARIQPSSTKNTKTKRGKELQKRRRCNAEKRERRTVNSIISDDTCHDLQSPYVCDENGLRECYISNPLDGSTLLTLRVMLDTGALGKGANYISQEVAKKLDDFGYEAKIVDKVVCGCFIGSTKRITKAYKLKLKFLTDEHTYTNTIVTCDVINTKYDVIIGFDAIKNCSYLREILNRNINNSNTEKHSTTSIMIDGEYCGQELVNGKVKPMDAESHDSGEVEETQLNTTMMDKIQSENILADDWQETGIQYGPREDVKQEAQKLCAELRKGFSRDLNKQHAKVTPMVIELTGDWEISDNTQNPRLQSLLKDKEISKQTTKMLQRLVIKSSRAKAHSQVMLTVKQDGSWRFCIDYRRLNAITKPNAWPLPRIRETLRRIGEHKPELFAVLDLTKGYYQAPLAEESQKYTAFITRDGKYEWTRVPMGLTGAPSYFQRVMTDEVLTGLVHHICEVYLDDIIIFGRNMEEFLKNLRAVLERLIEYNITLNPDKCRIGLEEIEYVGHVINKEGITFSREKLQKVIEVPLPKTAKHLRSFVGLANYFREHVRNHSARIEPLIRLLDDYNPRRLIDWDVAPEALEAFKDIQQAINECPQLFFMEEGESEVHLYTDASILGVGAYLCQRRPNGKEYPIGFFSKSLNKTEKAWGIPELEGYAIYAAFKHFDYLLRDAHTHVHTDHRNLVYIRDSGSDKVLRWKMMLQEYSFDVDFVAGVDNPIADFWSRNEAAEEDDYEYVGPTTKGNMLCQMDLESIDEEDSNAPASLAAMLRYCGEQDLNCELEIGNSLNVLESEEELNIPSDRYMDIKQCHNAHVGHHGVEQTMRALDKQNKTWDLRDKHVAKFCKECDTCQKHSYLQYKIAVPKYITGSYQPMERIQIDTVVGYKEDNWGYKGAIVIVDCFSRFTVCYPVKTLEAEEAADVLLTHTGHYGVPATLCSDGGKQYVNKIIASYLEHTGTDHIIGMAYSHMEQGIVERANQEVSRWVRDMLYDTSVKQDYWSRYLPYAQRIHNATPISSIGYAPAQILFGDRVDLERNILPQPTAEEPERKDTNTWIRDSMQFQATIIAAAQARLKKHEEKHLKSKEVIPLTEFPVDSYVLVAYPETGYGPRRPRKLYMMHRGPFQVVSREKNAITLRNLVTEKLEVKNIFLLRPFYWNKKEVTPREIALKDYCDEFDVESITAHTGKWSRKSQMQFQVKWLGYEDLTWESWANVRTSEAVKTYFKSQGKEKLLPKESVISKEAQKQQEDAKYLTDFEKEG